jgi:hypothetical protein
VLFDRCPADFLAYISVHEDADLFDFDAWFPRVRAAVQTLDLIVFLPIEARNRIVLSPSDRDDTRAIVDEQLREILLEDPFELAVEILEVEAILKEGRGCSAANPLGISALRCSAPPLRAPAAT